MFTENLFSQRDESFQNTTEKSGKMQNLLKDGVWEILNQIQLKDVSKSDLWQKGKPDDINIIKKTGGSIIVFAIAGFFFLMICLFCIGRELLNWYIEASSSGEITQFISLCKEFQIKEAFSLPLIENLWSEMVALILSFCFCGVFIFIGLHKSIYLTDTSIIIKKRNKYLTIPYEKFKMAKVSSYYDSKNTTMYYYTLYFAWDHEGEYYYYKNNSASNTSEEAKTAETIQNYAQPYMKQNKFDEYLELIVEDESLLKYVKMGAMFEGQQIKQVVPSY